MFGRVAVAVTVLLLQSAAERGAEEGAGGDDRAFKVRAEGLGDVGWGDFGEEVVDGDAGGVDEDVDGFLE